MLVACRGVELAAQLIESLLACAVGFRDRLLEPGDVALQAFVLGAGRSLGLGERRLELLDLGAQSVALLRDVLVLAA